MTEELIKRLWPRLCADQINVEFVYTRTREHYNLKYVTKGTESSQWIAPAANDSHQMDAHKLHKPTLSVNKAAAMMLKTSFGSK